MSRAAPFLIPFAVWLFTDNLVMAVALFVLVLIWTLLKSEEGPPVVAIAVTMQWIQVAVGVFYVDITHRPLEATLLSNYEPMVYAGLGCVAALTLGLWIAQQLMGRLKPIEGERPAYALSFKTLVLCYACAIAVVGAVQQLAWDYPSLTQAIIALTYLRFGILYLVLRRLVLGGRWDVFVGILLIEVALGFTGFYAGFREPLVMAVLALFEVFDRRNVRHWVTVAGLVAAMCVFGAMWVSIRGNFRERLMQDTEFAQNRQQRLDAIRTAASDWVSQDSGDLMGNMDRFVDRLWVVYYPALAMARVPNVLRHTDGQLMNATLQHLITPRVFFPDKPELPSDSELVRKYSGIFVAGEAEGTSIAFGYAAESYVDYGEPGMFVPALVYGVLMGLVYGGILRLIKHRDLAVAVATVICWLSLYLFERSWAKTIGLAGTLVIYVGGLTYIFDRLWYQKFRNERRSEWTSAPQLVDHRA